MGRIVVLDEDKIVEQGTHVQLPHASGRYANLWNRQAGGFIGVDTSQANNNPQTLN